jgi:hypothetical protein
MTAHDGRKRRAPDRRRGGPYLDAMRTRTGDIASVACRRAR